MEKDGWIKCEKNFGKKYYVLNLKTFNFDRYADSYFDGYEEHYMKRKKNFYRTNLDGNAINRQKMQRLEMMSESSMFLSEAGIHVFPHEKPYLRGEELSFWHPVFYQSVEIKEIMEDEEARAMASRMTGCICFEDRIFPVYSLADDLIKSGDITEKMMIERLNIFFSRRAGRMEAESAFLFTWKFEKLHERLALTPNDGAQFFLNENYRHYYLIPYSREGKRLIALLLKKYGTEELMNMVVRNAWRKTISMIDADGIDEDGVYIFNYLIPDIYRLKKMIKSANALKEKRFHVFCYSFQEKALIKELPENVTYSVYEFDAVEELCMKRIERRMNADRQGEN